jgi:2-hydroxy-4-carboxymuconate semialdehyde hemiacetal dehydrogenase
MAMSPAEAVRITERASRSDRRVMVCQTQRFLEPMQTMADWASGLKINHVVVRLVLNRTDNVGITGRLRTWTDDLVWHHGSHAVDTALWLLGEPAVDVSAVGVGMSTARTPMDVGILLRTGSGGLATIALSYTAHRPSTDLLVICDGETFRYERGLLTASDGRSCAYDEGRLFEDAVDRQDALFVESGDVTPTPAELARTYDALGRVAAALGAATR